MIREKGEALSPVKINRNVWSNSASQVKGLFTVSEHLLLTVTVYGLRERLERWEKERKEGREGEEGLRGEERGHRGKGRGWKKPRGKEGKCKYEDEKGAQNKETKGKRTKETP